MTLAHGSGGELTDEATICVRAQIKEKPKLSPEEARKQAEEVLRKAKEKREVTRPCSSLHAQHMVEPAS